MCDADGPGIFSIVVADYARVALEDVEVNFTWDLLIATDLVQYLFVLNTIFGLDVRKFSKKDIYADSNLAWLWLQLKRGFIGLDLVVEQQAATLLGKMLG